MIRILAPMPKVPRYTSFTPSSPATSETKRRNRSRDTRAEVLLRRELWKRGLRFRLHYTHLPGKPDIIFPRAKLVVFCDGDFWHGRNWKQRRSRLARGANAEYWIPKIQANIRRDRKVSQQLIAAGWKVLRFWETEVLLKPGAAAAAVEREIRNALEGE